MDLVVREGRGSVSLLQRSLGIGYGRAARLIDFMAEDGIVGNYNGSQAREVAITLEQWEAMQAATAAESEPPPVAKGSKKRSNKIKLDSDDEPALPPPRLKPVVETIAEEEVEDEFEDAEVEESEEEELEESA